MTSKPSSATNLAIAGRSGHGSASSDRGAAEKWRNVVRDSSGSSHKQTDARLLELLAGVGPHGPQRTTIETCWREEGRPQEGLLSFLVRREMAVGEALGDLTRYSGDEFSFQGELLRLGRWHEGKAIDAASFASAPTATRELPTLAFLGDLWRVRQTTVPPALLNGSLSTSPSGKNHRDTSVVPRLRAAEAVQLSEEQAPLQEKEDSLPGSLQIGAVLGRYRLLNRLGTGGAGVVFRAVNTKLDMPVAVKVLHESAQNRNKLEELRAEARLLAQINHPNVVRVFDFEDDHSIPYLVMEYVEGLNLNDVLKQRGPLNWRDAVSICLQAAEGLRAASKMGIVHRDIKPGNILLTDEGVAKVTDLGLGRFLSVTDDSAQRGTFVGTVSYMAPEQALCVPNLDCRADMYALGATLYHLLTGKPPFTGTSAAKVLLEHQKSAVVPPDQHVPGLPAAVSGLVVRLLAKSPTNRFPDYNGLCDAFRQLLAMPEATTEEAVKDGERSEQGRSRSWLRKLFTRKL